LWDERVVKAIVGAAWEDFRAERWGRDFADKLRQRGITKEMVRQTLDSPDIIVLFRHFARWAVGFWSGRTRIVVVWSPFRLSRWVTAFRRRAGWDYLLGLEDATLLWRKE